MLEERLCARKRVPSATFVSRAFVRGYRLRFHKRSSDCSGKCNIVQTELSEDLLHGVVFEVPDGDLPALDRAEGVGHGYHHQDVTITIDDNDSVALAYVADSDRINDSLIPYVWYHQLVISGATQHNLPIDYVAGLRAIPFTDDPESARLTKIEAEAALRAYDKAIEYKRPPRN